MPLGAQIVLTILVCIAILMGILLIYDLYTYARDLWKERKEKAMDRINEKLNRRLDNEGLDIYQRVEFLRAQNDSLRRRLNDLEDCYERDIEALCDYLNVELQYIPSEHKLVKVKKKSQK